MYINPKTNKPCEIEEVIDFLIEHREKYFKEMSNA
jgi:capsule polysaccharide export protein KpsC/LpsZ